MILTDFQKDMDKERRKVIKKFQKKYKTSEKKEDALKEMQNNDINFLIYCSDNLYANIFYSRFLKREQR
jgi:hypothetical protein